MKTYMFHRDNVFYMLDLETPEGMTEAQMIKDHAECNPGTRRVEGIDGRVVWQDAALDLAEGE